MDLSAKNNNKVDFVFSLNQNSFHLTTDALKASTRKRASCFNKERHLDPPASESFSYLLLMTKLCTDAGDDVFLCDLSSEKTDWMSCSLSEPALPT